MSGWRSKLIFMLIVYFAGFATAIYCLAPAPENDTGRDVEKSFVYSVIKSDEFANNFNRGMHKCFDFARDTAKQAGVFIKQKYEDINSDS